MEQRVATEQQLAWERACPEAITSDVIWKLDAYRAALFLLHVARGDCTALRDARSEEFVREQLISAAGSVSASLAEGYSRSTRADRLRFFGYSLGSTRECVTWYEAARSILPDEHIDDRLVLLMRIRALVLALIRSLREGRGGRFER